MATARADEVNPEEFEAKLAECPPGLIQVVEYLRATASHAGADLTYRRFKHPAPNSGWGITFYLGDNPFCDLHPKTRAEIVWLRLNGVDRKPIVDDGFEPSEQDGWFKVKTMHDAVRAVKWILAAHEGKARAA